MYHIVEIGPEEYHIYLGEHRAARLKGGAALLIASSWVGLKAQGEFRAHEYLAGVVQGIIHMEMIKGEG